MKRLNRKLEYALMALKYMSEKYSGQLTSVKEICDAVGSPFDVTARVMQQMVHKGLLKSEQGVRGGYMIVRDLSKVTMYELMEIVEGHLSVVRCLHNVHECEIVHQCNVQTPMTYLNNKLAQFYSSLTIQEVLQIKDRKVALRQQVYADER